MQAPTSTGMPPHWSPVKPSWFVSVGLILLAALPHKLPVLVHKTLGSMLGAIVFAAISAWTFTQIPYLGIAMFILLAGVWIRPRDFEGFIAPILNKDKVTTKKRWLEEEVMMEDPHQIQERTEGPTLNLDEIGHDDAQPWHVEDVFGEHPTGIQERPVDTALDYEHSAPSWRH